jgi:uncharacterized membrane protein YbhN (UPF0104 family)
MQLSLRRDGKPVIGRHAMVTCARLAVTVGAAWLVVRSIDWPTLINLLGRADLARLAIAGLVLSMQFILIVWRWQVVIESLGGGTVAGGALAAALGRSMLIGQLLPSTVGGDLARALALTAHTGFTLAVRSVICDRIIALAVLVALVVITLPLFAWLVEMGPAFFTLTMVAIGGLAAFVAFLTEPGLLNGLPRLGRHAVMVAADARGALTGARGRTMMLLALATHLFGVLLIYELACALTAPITLLDCLLIVPPALLISAVPISLGGWGVREGVFATGFVLVGATSEAGVATSVLFGLTGPLIGLVTELATPLMQARDVPPKDVA